MGQLSYPTAMEFTKPEIMPVIDVNGIELATAHLPRGLVCDAQTGVVLNESMQAERLHRWPEPFHRVFECRSVMTPGGDYLLVTIAGKAHYGSRPDKVNDLFAYRSSDKGKTWQGPQKIWDVEYNQHGFVPLVPRGSSRIYAFGTEPAPDHFPGFENASIGMRYSDDDGHTWSPVSFIEPVNDPDYMGITVIQMTETERGTWLVGAASHDMAAKNYTVINGVGRLDAQQYFLRSTDQGKTWTLLPDAYPNGWITDTGTWISEARPVDLGNGRIFALARTPNGFLWELRSEDDGQTWARPKASPLVHPDAPGMLFLLSDRRTLACFHHNWSTGTYFNFADRSELWLSLSHDGGYTWDEPRFVAANAEPLADYDRQNPFHLNMSYIDCLVDGGDLHLFIPHRWRQLLHMTLKESDLALLPTRAGLNV